MLAISQTSGCRNSDRFGISTWVIYALGRVYQRSSVQLSASSCRPSASGYGRRTTDDGPRTTDDGSIIPPVVANVVSCPSCGAIVLPLESGNICPHCRTPLDASADVTRLADPAALSPPAAQPAPGPSST